ncbi:hypothetical protein [Ferrimonas lipolytica]|uniref:Uncharacterized protein n=1 Tax=Ferrimonas lipolytica TaxID=2724191 RepID=A0A6H1UEA1_9GAMM|nr:hypothetical protein [Ferrimonas lipolytica]QIZ77437.1 hypothetical protein HER31_11410 [Ferrimonas lipolytica]
MALLLVLVLVLVLVLFALVLFALVLLKQLVNSASVIGVVICPSDASAS